MAFTKFQLEESKKPNPRYILELRTIREMIQEADNIDKGLRTVLDLKPATQGNAPVLQQLQKLNSMGHTPSFTQPVIPAVPPVSVGGSLPPSTALVQLGQQSQAQAPGAAILTLTTPTVPTFTTPTGLASFTKNLLLDNRAHINQASALLGTVRVPPQLIPNPTQLQRSVGLAAKYWVYPVLAQEPSLPTVGRLAPPPTAQSTSASGMSSVGSRVTGAGSNGGAQSQSGSVSAHMSAPFTQGGMNNVASSSILTQSAGAVPMRRPTAEEVAIAKKWVEEQKRTAFSRSSYIRFLIQSLSLC